MCPVFVLESSDMAHWGLIVCWIKISQGFRQLVTDSVFEPVLTAGFPYRDQDDDIALAKKARRRLLVQG